MVGGAGGSAALAGHDVTHRSDAVLQLHVGRDLVRARHEPVALQMPVRVLQVWGDRSEPRPDRQAMRIPDRENIQLHWIEGGSHALPLQKPAQVAAAINQFVHSRQDP